MELAIIDFDAQTESDAGATLPPRPATSESASLARTVPAPPVTFEDDQDVTATFTVVEIDVLSKLTRQ